jgi:hypothetical protein
LNLLKSSLIQKAIFTTKARKNKNTKKKLIKFRAHAAQAPALRVPIFVFPWLFYDFAHWHISQSEELPLGTAFIVGVPDDSRDRQ